MNILVIGGTGNVGSQVVKELLARNQSVTVLTRSADKVNSLPSGVKGVVGGLLDPNTVRTAFKGMDAVFLVNAVSANEAHEGLMAVNGARLAGVRKLVYLSVHKADKAPNLPHFGAKLAVEAAIKASDIPHVILRPNHFFQNDLWIRDALLAHRCSPGRSATWASRAWTSGTSPKPGRSLSPRPTTITRHSTWWVPRR
jgi:uncharacterized protein YbjT (DUF2867 family)